MQYMYSMQSVQHLFPHCAVKFLSPISTVPHDIKLYFVFELCPSSCAWLSICGPRTDVRNDQNLENKIKPLKIRGIYRYLLCPSVSVESQHRVL